MEGLINDGRLLTIILKSGYAVVWNNILQYFIKTLPDTGITHLWLTPIMGLEGNSYLKVHNNNVMGN